VIARQSVWSDERVIKLLEQFIPAADEVGWLQRGDDAECRLFQKIAEQGHYAGRVRPTNTRQGIYAAAPSGVMLASINTRSADQMVGMLESALARWSELPAHERWLDDESVAAVTSTRRWEHLYPEDGLVVRVDSRDLPRETDARPANDWRRAARNRDFLWLTAEEAESLVPAEEVVGAAIEWPDAVVRRVVSLNLVDNVCGQVPPFENDSVEQALIRSTIESVQGVHRHIRIEGESRAVANGRWSVDGFNDMNDPSEQERGIETRLLGFATFDAQERRFTAFELIAIGDRWGATQYNGRTDDAAGAGIGYLFTLAESHERAAPAFIWRYGWRK
jgi:hypothetical protein